MAPVLARRIKHLCSVNVKTIVRLSAHLAVQNEPPPLEKSKSLLHDNRSGGQHSVVEFGSPVQLRPGKRLQQTAIQGNTPVSKQVKARVEHAPAWRRLPPVPLAVFKSAAVRDASRHPGPAPNEPLLRVAHGEHSDPI